MLLQVGPGQTAIYIMLPVLFGLALLLLKLGLVLTKAEVRTGFKWVLASFGLQVGLFFFVASPLILIGITGGFGEAGPNFILIVLFSILALFIDINFLNIFHRLGIKRALIVFIMIIIPFILVITFLIMMLTSF
ncbi:MAG: hypothetical protein GF383_12705 [Candidatus Lokiarchaeota archaeon]|nr:hypothetical protein [Candidatus Lokiarchaeota archaeon]MBD3341919.1 hypothetical protein [Candidatus Lokiarchaeota archaeon]